MAPLARGHHDALLEAMPCAQVSPLVVLFLFLVRPHTPHVNMPHIHTSVVSSSHFQLIVIRALKTYKELTRKDLFAHALAAQLRACNSPGAILFVLQQQVQVQNQSRCSHERLTHCLDLTVNVLYTFSRALEDGVGLVCFRTWF